MLAQPGYTLIEPRAKAWDTALFERVVRRRSISWRILAIAVFNSLLAVILLVLVWNGARALNGAWNDLQRVRQSERFLTSLDRDAERLQSLIHRYIAWNDPDVHSKVIDLNENLISRLRVQARLDPLIAEPTRPLVEITERFITGFDDLRTTRADIARIYDSVILRSSREMSGFFAELSAATLDPSAPVGTRLTASREAYNAMVLAANAFYLSGAEGSAREAKSQAEAISREAVSALGLLDDQRNLRPVLSQLNAKAALIRRGVDELSVAFANQGRLLRTVVDENARAMSATVESIVARIHDLEQAAQTQFDRTLQDVAIRLSSLAVAFLALVVLISLRIARSISEPLGDLRTAMQSIGSGELDRPIKGVSARDEVGDMARALEGFRESAIAKQRTEDELRHAKDKAESALAELRDTQASLIAAEKLAALGGLVAGVAHEVNNPVGISLTVASTLAQRCEAFATEVASGQIRRSKLEDFLSSAQTAAGQLVANLMRAGELVQSFKQVAVDRSQAERRVFDLGEATEQILTSLRPTLKTSNVALAVRSPRGIEMDGYPGPLGQILTNLFLNALHHAFDEHRSGTITVELRRSGTSDVELIFSDDGRGMTEEVRRCAFDPFFTTRRGLGGTGLGLHIVHNLVTARLGGRISLASAPDRGSVFRIVLPRVAPRGPALIAPAETEIQHV